MQARATAKAIRMAPDKVRLVIDLIRGLDLDAALNILNNMNRKAAVIINKVVMSAAANAEHNLKLDRSKLYIEKAYVNEGKVMKRQMADSRGHSGRKDHRTSHITIIVSEKEK